MKRGLMWTGAILALVIFSGLTLWLTVGNAQIRISEDTVRQIVAKTLPKESKGVVVESGEVSFEANAIRVKLSMHGEKLGQTFALVAETVGVPRYEPSGGEFFFTSREVQVHQFILNEGKSITDRLKGAVDRYLPEWKGGENLAQDVGAKLDGWVTAAAEEGAIFALERMPIYRLPDDVKGLAAQAVLDKVIIEGKELVVTFTLWRLTWWVLGFVVSIFLTIGFMIALVRNPGWGTAALAGVSLLGE